MTDNNFYQFTVPDVHGKQRGRTFMPPGAKYPVTTTPPKTRNFEALVKMCATEAGVQMMKQCRVVIAVCIPAKVTPRKTMPDKIEEPRRRPDLDNVAKSIMDALNGIAYNDDKDVLDVMVFYQFLKPPATQLHTIVEIYEAKWEDHLA